MKDMLRSQDTLNWYALYTAPRAEKQVKERLDRMGLENWLPLHRAPRVWSDRVKMVEIPLFSSYIFVRCEEYSLRPLLSIYGVARIVFYDGKPAVVKDREVLVIKQFLEQASEHPMCIGDEVDIICGAMKNISGKIKKVKKSHLVLFLEQLGATVCVRLDAVVRAKE